ncbi:MAG: heme ABC transporter ATP-binding protein [Methylomicrobium sp.]
MLEARAIEVVIGGQRLVHDVTLNVKPGEVLAVVGPNGAGKSTLLKTLCGDLTPRCGFVSMNGIPLDDWPLPERACIRGVLPQSSILSFPFTVSEVVAMGRSPHRNKRAVVSNEMIVRQAMRLTDTEALGERVYTTLSGGERQRVQLARVLAQIWEPVGDQPRYLLLDEPTSALDLAHQHSVLAIARQLAVGHGIGVLSILHDLNLAALYADRLAVLHLGRLMAFDSPERVLNADFIRDIFGYPVTVTRHPLQSACPWVVPHLKGA